MTIVIYGSKYWKNVIDLELLAEKGAIAVNDVDLFQFADTPEEAFRILKEGLTKYHLDGVAADQGGSGPVPNEPAPSAEELLGPGIARTR
jgi:predicted Rossmann-fold nucleotide-binding protein